MSGALVALVPRVSPESVIYVSSRGFWGVMAFRGGSMVWALLVGGGVHFFEISFRKFGLGSVGLVARILSALLSHNCRGGPVFTFPSFSLGVRYGFLRVFGGWACVHFGGAAVTVVSAWALGGDRGSPPLHHSPD